MNKTKKKLRKLSIYKQILVVLIGLHALFCQFKSDHDEDDTRRLITDI